MKKNIRRTPVMLLVLAVILAMSLGGLTTAFADAPAYENDILQGDEAHPVDAKLTKVLEIPEGTTITSSGITYSFLFTPKGKDGVTKSAITDAMPKIGTNGVVTVGFGDSDKGSLHVTSSGGIVSIATESALLFGSVGWESAGVYEYEVTEIAGPASLDEGDFTAKYTYSGASYTVNVGVANGGPNGLYIDAISSKRTKDDDGGDITGGEKVDPTPGDGSTKGDYSRMIFTNGYTKTKNGTSPLTDGTLFIENAVGGDYGDKEIYFPFAVTITQPAISTNTAPYKAYIVSGGAVVIPDATTNGTPDDVDGSFDFVSGTERTDIKLKHGQQLVFVGTPVGTAYEASEPGASGYVPAVSIVYDGGTAVDFGGTGVKAAGAGLSTEEVTGAIRLVGELGSSAVFTNANDSTVPAGIDLNTIPFIGLIALALGALALYVTLRSRRRRSHSRSS